MIAHTITLKNGRQINLTHEEAQEMHQQLELLFGSSIQKLIPTPYTPFQPPQWPLPITVPYEVWCKTTQ